MKYTANWESLDRRPIPKWFEDAKFGIFVHWGVYSVPAWRKVESAKYASYAEWYYARVMYSAENGGKDFHAKNYGPDFEYRDFAPMFRAELFDPDFYASLFQEAGAQYVVLTSKHHDGYCLFNSKSKHKKNWNAVAVGPQRDLVDELSRAIRNVGLKMGLYYSIPEWESIGTHRTESGWFLPKFIIDKYGIAEEAYVKEVLNVELKQLLEDYSPSVLFADGGEWDMEEDFVQTKSFLAWLYSESGVREEIVVNDRFAKGMPGRHGDYFSSEYKDAQFDETRQHPWEESRGLGGSYGFNRAERLNDYLSTSDLIEELIDVVSRGGNFLLNVGPHADGRIEVIMEERLRELGAWLKVNGDGIYGTRRFHTPHLKCKGQDIWFTKKADVVFLFFNQYLPSMSVPAFQGETIKRVQKIELLGSGAAVEWSVNEEGDLEISLPRLLIGELPCLHFWTLKVLLQ